jgi:Cu/Zn superoxide dismutase
MAPRKPTETMVVQRVQHQNLMFLRNEVGALAHAMLGIDTGEVFCCMTCTEADALADVLSAGGHPDAAAWVLNQHAMSDREFDDLHHDIYLKEWDTNA